MARPSTLRRGCSSLSTQYILVKQRHFFRSQWLVRLRQRQTLRSFAFTRLVSVLSLCGAWTLAFLATGFGLAALVSRAPTELAYHPAWHSILYGVTFLYALLLELTAHTKHSHLKARSNGTTQDTQLATSATQSLPFTIFVEGTGEKVVSLQVTKEATIDDIFTLLRRRHLVMKSNRVHQFLVYPTVSLSPLPCSLHLRDSGVGSGSTLHLRTRVLGGARSSAAPSPGAGPSHAAKFTKKQSFPSEHPEFWKPLTSSHWGYFRCQLCNLDFQSKRITSHEQSKAHQGRVAKALKKGKSKMPTSNPGASENSAPGMRSSSESGVREAVMPMVRSALVDVLEDTMHDFEMRRSDTWDPDEPGVVDWNLVPSAPSRTTFEDEALARLSARLSAYLSGEGALDDGSEDDDEGRAELEEEADGAEGEGEWNTGEEWDPSQTRRTRARRKVTDEETPWFPWPDKETCVLDIIRHIPRCAFSDRQNTVIHWALCAMGLKEIPSNFEVNRVAKSLQDICGVQSIRYEGALGHVYYVNDLAGLIAQEMANPRVRPYLHFLPEDAGCTLSEAWQAARWRTELDPNLASPMVRKDSQDFYVYEPAQLDNGQLCIPVRWFTRGEETFAEVWEMTAGPSREAWTVLKHKKFEVNVSHFILSFPHLVEVFKHHGHIPDPRKIIGIETELNGGIQPWTHSDPSVGNRWRRAASGHRVVAFPIWLYCDDTSGNLSKKWNKHNSFLFTAAGLPRHLVHHEYNIHFLSTSNLAPPLEMLDGIVDQLRDCQTSGIWAWDCVLKEVVLVVPSVLAMLGDNPMQSEIACHVGLAGKLFCRVCGVSKGNPEGDPEDAEPLTAFDDAASVHSHAGSVSDGVSITSSQGGAHRGQNRRKKKLETMGEMVNRVRRFMSAGLARTRVDTLKALRYQFCEAQRVGGQATVLRERTRAGVKDTFQTHFINRLFSLTTAKGRSVADKVADVAQYTQSIPYLSEAATSPVWRIQDFDPHADTPVEILHVILLGFVKYFWRDTVQRLKDAEKETLTARLSSFDVSGLGIPPLSGRTLVTYAKSLVGRDFRAIAQAAPFVLHGLDNIPDELIKVWIALSRLVPLVWQPEIRDITAHLGEMTQAISNFLDATCELTPRWFNKPKFHVVLHLPEHVRRFGPPMLFATEGFESFNAVIRSHSIHSNHRAPSRDIAAGMVHHNRIRHFLSSGVFSMPRVFEGRADEDLPDIVSPERSSIYHARSSWLAKMHPSRFAERTWRSIGPEPLKLLSLGGFDVKVLGLITPHLADHDDSVGLCRKLGDPVPWSATQASKLGLSVPAPQVALHSRRFRLAENIFLGNNEWCGPASNPWVLWRHRTSGVSAPGNRSSLGRIKEILQAAGTANEKLGKGDWVVLQLCNLGGEHPHYGMPRVAMLQKYIITPVQNICCAVNVQHDCATAQCPLENTRIIYQEREETSQRGLAVRHIGQDYVLNTGQMRDAAEIQPHYPPFQSVRAREEIIHQAAMREVALARRRNETGQQTNQVPLSLSAASRVQASQARSASRQPPTALPSSSHMQHDDSTSRPTSGTASVTPSLASFAHTSSRPIAAPYARRTALMSSYNVYTSSTR